MSTTAELIEEGFKDCCGDEGCTCQRRYGNSMKWASVPEDATTTTFELDASIASIYTDPETGGQKGVKDAKLGGADPLALQELALVYGFGEAKYDRWNYLKGYPWSLSIDALYRHFLAFQAGEDIDPESGRHHMAHVAWHALTLVSYLKRGVGTDDRAPE